MFEIFIYSILITVLYSPYGIFLLKDFKPNIYHLSKQLIFGSIIICFISLVLNMLFPLNKFVTSSLIFFSIFLIFKKKDIFFSKKFLKFIILQSFIITILITESNVYRPDAGLYHLPFIGILNSEKIIFGISNLHSRYGHISILQYYSAISNNFLFNNNGIVFPSAIIASATIINFSSQILKYIKKNNHNFHFLFIFFIFIYICYKMNRYGEYGNDAPAHFLLFFLVSELLININKISYKDFGNNLLLTLFIVQNKLTLIFIIFLNFFNFKKINYKLFIKDKRFFFLSIFFSVWIIKNIFSTGCMLYPIEASCFESLKWTNIKEIREISLGSEVWTKDWSNFENSSKISQEEFLSNFNWLDSWMKNHFKVIMEILIPYLVVSLILIVFLTYKNKKNKSSLNNYYFYFFIIFLSGSLFWFLKSPLYRYGYSFLICTFAFIFAFYCSKFSFMNKKDNKIFSFILILGLSTIISKNMIRINISDNEYYNYPWPKFYSMDKKNKLPTLDKTVLNKKIIYHPKKGDYCMYNNILCNQYGIDDDLKLINSKNKYLIFFKK